LKAKYDKIGNNYNATRKADKYLTEKLLHYLNPRHNGIYLDIGCGTGNYTIQFQKKGYNFIGIDPSKEMLYKAKQKNNKIKWRIGKAEKIDLKDNSIDGIIASLTIHHWSNLIRGFQEMNRVLRESGQVVIFTASQEQMQGYWLNHYFPEMIKNSIKQMPAFEKVNIIMKESGFKLIGKYKYFVKPDLQDLFLYSGKHNPELYLSPVVRNGISSFTSIADINEVKKGLDNLQEDINSGKINEIINAYKNKLGDYIFIVGQK
jgi:SAM-dependent methyltransferase